MNRVKLGLTLIAAGIILEFLMPPLVIIDLALIVTGILLVLLSRKN